MDSIDYDAREKAYKALTIIFLVLTVLVNFGLLWKIIQAAGGCLLVPRGPRGPRLQTLISLALGDTMVGLFSLVVQAIILFGDVDDVSCRSRVLASYYHSYIMPFVYAVGLVVLAIECAQFRKRARAEATARRSTGLSTAGDGRPPGAIISIAASAAPWLLGIVVALPLCIAEFDYDRCINDFTLSRARAINWVCLLVPAGLAIVAAFVNMCGNSSSPATTVGLQPAMTTSSNPAFSQTTVTHTVPTSPIQASAPYSEAPPSYQEAQGDFSKLHPGSPAPPPSAGSSQPYQPTLAYQQPHQGYTQYGPPQAQQAHPYYYAGQPPQYITHPPAQSPNLQAGSVTFTPAGQTSILPPSPTLAAHFSTREKTALLIATLAFCVCSVPLAFWNLGYILNEDRTTLKLLPYAIISGLVFWLSIVRAFVVPFIWIASDSVTKPKHSSTQST